MKQKTNGFTIVELLIVIVVIAILAAITLVSYNGIQRRAYNTATISAVQSWIKVLAASYVTNGTITITRESGDNSICLGNKSQYPYINDDMKEGQCYDYAHTSDQLMSSISGVADVSMKTKVLDSDGLRGIQYAYFSGNKTSNIWYMLQGENQDCGIVGSDYITTDDGNTECHVVLNDIVGGIPVWNDDWM